MSKSTDNAKKLAAMLEAELKAASRPKGEAEVEEAWQKLGFGDSNHRAARELRAETVILAGTGELHGQQLAVYLAARAAGAERVKVHRVYLINRGGTPTVDQLMAAAPKVAQMEAEFQIAEETDILFGGAHRGRVH